MTILFSIVTLISAILQIILFFKVWAMTNDVRKIRYDNTTLRKGLDYEYQLTILENMYSDFLDLEERKMYKEAIRKGEDFVYYANKHARKHFESKINKVDILVERMKNNSDSAIE